MSRPKAGMMGRDAEAAMASCKEERETLLWTTHRRWIEEGGEEDSQVGG